MRNLLLGGTLLLALVVEVSANPQCSHLDDDVICPDGVMDGSVSNSFTTDGILWSDGTETLGTDVDLFVDCPPDLPTMESGPGGSLVNNPVDTPVLLPNMPPPSADVNIGDSVEDQLSLTSDPGESPGSRGRKPAGFQFSDTHVVIDLVDGGAGGLAEEFGAADAETKLKIREALYLPGYVNDAPIAGTREAILDKYARSGDLAGAATALADGSINYDQTTNEELSQISVKVTGSLADGVGIKEKLTSQFIGVASSDNVMYTTRGNCYEFVHLAAYFSGNGFGQVSTDTGVDNLINESTREVWDGSSEIPKGKIVIGAVWNNDVQGGQDKYGFFHVGISLGDGWVVSNRGSGVQIERLDAVFGSNWYQNVYFGEYGGYERPDSTKEFLTRQSGEMDYQIEAVRTDEDLNAEQKEAEIAMLRERQALHDYLVGNGERPSDLSPEGEDYRKYLDQLTEGIAEDKPFYFSDYKTYTAAQNQPPRFESTISAGPQPPEPPVGRETAILIADWFNVSEAGNLGVPQGAK